MPEFSKRVFKKLSKLSENQIEKLINNFLDKNDTYDSIFQSLFTGLIVVDNDWHLITLNKAAERFIPIKSSIRDPKNENMPVWKFIEDEDIQFFLRDCNQNNKTNVRDEYTLSTSGGSVRFIDIAVSPLLKNKDVAGSIILIEDVTAKRNQDILLHRMETMASLTNIAASVAHEIKNPLGAISIHIQLMQKAIKKKRDGDGGLPDKKFMEDYLSVVNQEIDRLNKIVVDFLMAVRPISTQMTLTDPNKLLSQFISFITPEFTEKHIEIDYNLCEKCPRLLLDEKLFREVIVNLAQNSIAAIEERFGNSSLGKLIIKTEIKDDQFVLYFCDNGCGMSEETVSRIFEPYYTTKANGTGLGMAMVYKIIKEFSGDIVVKSSLGDGTLFTITLPVPQVNKRLLTHKDCEDQTR